MKKYLVSAAVLGTLALGTLFTTVSPKADTTATGSATVNLEAGDMSVTGPSFNFGTLTIGQNVAGTHVNQTANQLLTMTNFTGSSDPWTVTASLTAMNNTDGAALPAGASLSFVGQGAVAVAGTTAKAPTNGGTAVNVVTGGDAGAIETAAAGEGMGQYTDDYTQSTLTIPTAGADSVKAGTYSGVITYTMSNTAAE